MKRLFLIHFVFLISTLIATAQTSIEKDETKPNWRLFEPPNEEFTIEAPITLNAVDFLDKTSRLYNGQVEGTYFFAFSFKDRENNSYKLIVEFAKSHQKSPVQENLGNAVVEKYSFTDEDGFHHEMIFANTKKRKYIFQTTSLQSDNALSDKFLATIRVDRKYTPQLVSAPESSAINLGTGNRAGTGSGAGVGFGQASRAPAADVQANPNRTTSLQILSKPRAAYTDLARFYNINGIIRIRVTLLASGTVGAVTPVSKLPFGLLNSALTAAKNIRFEPKYINGVPVSTIVAIEYGFTIY